MSLYPILWAVEHAPVRDAEERAILVALVSKGDFDGCNCYRSYATLASVARVDERTAMRKVKAMTGRGMIRPQRGPKPESWKKLPKDRRPVVREVMVPASFWSAVQLEEINHQRMDRGRAPITPESRPDLSEAPPKKARADKGKPNPKRSRKKTLPSGGERGVSETPRPEAPETGSGVSLSHLAGCLSVTSRGVSQSPNPPLSPPAFPSSPLVPPGSGKTDCPSGHRSGREDETPANTDEHQAGADEDTGQGGLERAQMLVDRSVRLWPKDHRAPSARDRQRLCERVAAELAAGGDDTVIVHELSRDLRDAGSAVKVIMGSRTKVAGWGQAQDPRSEHSRHQIRTRTPWCGNGACDEHTRLANVYDPASGETRPAQCRAPVTDPVTGHTVACHPRATARLPEPENTPEMEEMEPDELAAASYASLLGADQVHNHADSARELLAQRRTEKEARKAEETAAKAAAKKALSGIVDAADREKAGRR